MGEMNHNRGAGEEIDLRGNLTAGKQRTSVPPIQVFITDWLIEVDFNATLGTIVISIYDETDSTVYLQSVNTYDGQQILIDITSFEEGEYLIEFVNSKGEYLCGSFVI